jgi:hypothetical protein
MRAAVIELYRKQRAEVMKEKMQQRDFDADAASASEKLICQDEEARLQAAKKARSPSALPYAPLLSPIHLLFAAGRCCSYDHQDGVRRGLCFSCEARGGCCRCS